MKACQVNARFGYQGNQRNTYGVSARGRSRHACKPASSVSVARLTWIESRIVIASSDFAHELGVRFGVSYLHDGSNVGVVAADGVVADSLRNRGISDPPPSPTRYQVNLPAADANAATMGLSFLSGDVILDLELSALETEGDGEVISTPRVVTANQMLALIR